MRIDIKKNLLVLGVLGSLLVLPSAAFAQTASPTPATQAQRISDLHTKCDDAISQRLASLNSTSTRINGLAKLSASDKAKFSGEIATDLSGLTALKAKCDADTDLATLRADYQSVFTQYRIYAVFLPQLNLLVASDTMSVTTDKLNTLATDLQARIQTAGNPSNLTTLLADMQAKIADAKTQYGNVESQITPLTPNSFNTDPNGTKTIETNARGEIKTGSADLKAAYQDALQIRTGLKGTTH